MPIIWVHDLGRRWLEESEFAVWSGEWELRRVLTDEEIRETAPFISKTHDAVLTVLN